MSLLVKGSVWIVNIARTERIYFSDSQFSSYGMNKKKKKGKRNKKGGEYCKSFSVLPFTFAKVMHDFSVESAPFPLKKQNVKFSGFASCIAFNPK